MSADNYNLVKRMPDGRWHVFINLSASSDDEHNLINSRGNSIRPDAVTDQLSEAIKWANEHCDTEYGTRVYQPEVPMVVTDKPSPHWRSMEQPGLEIELRHICMVRQPGTGSFVSGSTLYTPAPNQLAAYASGGLVVLIPLGEEESFLEAWRASP